LVGGCAAGISKTLIERIKLLVQSQEQMIKQERLDRHYDGILDCTRRTMADDDIVALWRGNLASPLLPHAGR